MALTLIFGNKNYSSWSLRPWLLLRHFGLPFHEQRLALFTPETTEKLSTLSPTGLVPVLLDDDLCVWDSLAICEYLSEQYLQGRGWPLDAAVRAAARSAAAEMHSGFSTLRSAWPMNIRLQRKLQPDTACQRDIQRIDSLWSQCLQRHGGPWLFGEFSIADAMFAPVVLRFRSYQPSVGPEAADYMQTMLAHQAVQEWMAAAINETEVIAVDEVDAPQQSD